VSCGRYKGVLRCPAAFRHTASNGVTLTFHYLLADLTLITDLTFFPFVALAGRNPALGGTKTLAIDRVVRKVSDNVVVVTASTY